MRLNNIKDIIPFKVYQWSDNFKCRLSQESIASIFKDYRIHMSSNIYPLGLRIPTSTRNVFRFVLSGECHYLTTELDIKVRAEEFVLLNEGDYELKIIDKSICHIISVWIYPIELSKLIE